MGEPLRGEIYLVQFPEETKARPALIVSPDVRNRLANDVIVVPLTTKGHPSITHVFLEAGEGGLRLLSIAKCEQVTTVPKFTLQRGPLGGQVSLVRMHEIERAIMRAIGVVTP